MKYKGYVIKRKIENVFIYPFIVIGRMIALAKPLEKDYDHFYFFPFYHIGGAEKVHYQIAQATGKKNSIIFFTKKSLNDLYYDQFRATGCTLVDISLFTDNKFLYFNNLIYRGIISGYINSQPGKPVVFNGQCNFGYKISPWIKSGIPQLELIHSLCSFSYIRIPFLSFYYSTVMISKRRIQDHLQLYKEYKIPDEYSERITFILNGIPLPSIVKTSYNFKEPLNILYVGRDTEEKRVQLIAQVARRLSLNGVNATVTFMGDVSSVIPVDLHPFCTFLGNKSDDEEISKIYLQADVLLMLSTTEGFPMAIMEAMARGLSIVSTAVGEIPYHVKNDVNGYLIEEVTIDDLVSKIAIERLTNIAIERNKLADFGEANIQHASAYFGIEQFSEKYDQLFIQATTDSGQMLNKY